MAEHSKIEWTDHTFNPWIGCTKVSPGCEHCYAEADQDQRRGRAQWGPKGTRSMTSESYWRQPLRWNREAKANCVRRRVFCGSLCDVFEDWDGLIVDHKGCAINKSDPYKVTTPGGAMKTVTDMLLMDDIRLSLFSLIDQTPHIDWLLLTKRPENILRRWPARRVQCARTNPHGDQCTKRSGHDGTHHALTPSHGWGKDAPTVTSLRDNVFLGTSIENQEQADKRIPELLDCRDLSKVLFVSCEPLLGAVELWPWIAPKVCNCTEDDDVTPAYSCDCFPGKSLLDWVIAGGESGPHARPIHPDWARSLRDQCQAAGVPYLFKQWGEWSEEPGPVTKQPADFDGFPPLYRVGKKAAGRLLDGREWNEFPETQGVTT